MRDSCLDGCLEGCLIAWLLDGLLGPRDGDGPGCGCPALLLLILIAAGAVITFLERFEPLGRTPRRCGERFRQRDGKETEVFDNRRQGCLAGLLQLFLLDRLFDWLQGRYGFGRGASCSGIGCGCLLLILFVFLACSITSGTDWFRLSF